MLDSTINANHGTPESGPTSELGGIADRALRFDTGARVYMLDASGALDFDETESFSFSLWAFVSEYSGIGDTLMQQFGGAGVGFNIDIQPGEFWYVGLYSGMDSSTASLGSDAIYLGKWSHIVGVVDRGRGSIQSFGDGAFVNQNTLTIGSISNQAGVQLCPGGNSCKGVIDEARIYGVALEPDWIALEHRNLDPDAPAFVTPGALEQQ
jgi:hypothetical protein